MQEQLRKFPGLKLRRALAFVVDLAIIFVAWSYLDNQVPVVIPGWALGPAIMFCGYFAFTEGRGRHASPGKRLVKATVVTADGSTPSMRVVLTRAMILAPFVSVDWWALAGEFFSPRPGLFYFLTSTLPLSFFALNAWLVLRGPHRLMLQDELTGTRVVDSRAGNEVADPERSGDAAFTRRQLLASTAVFLITFVLSGSFYAFALHRSWVNLDGENAAQRLQQYVLDEAGVRNRVSLVEFRQIFGTGSYSNIDQRLDVVVWIPRTSWAEETAKQVASTISSHFVQSYYEKARVVVETGIALKSFREYPLTNPWSPRLQAIYDQVTAAYTEGRYAEGVALAEEAVRLATTDFGSESIATATMLSNLALLKQAQGRYDEAEPLSRRALAIQEKVIGNDNAIALRLNNLAMLYVAQSRFGEAEPLLLRAITIQDRADGSDEIGIAGSLNNLALVYQGQGRHGEAEPLLKRALAIEEKALGPDDPRVATSLSNLAQIYRVQSRYDEAKPLAKRALTIDEKALGPHHPEVAKDLNNFALFYQLEGRFDEAEPLYLRAIAIGEKTLGPEHPELAVWLESLGVMYSTQGFHNKAEPLLRRCLTAREKAFGPEHLLVAQTLFHLARAYGGLGQYGQAEKMVLRDLAISEKALGRDHPNVGVSLDALAAVYIAQNRYVEAEPLLQRALTIEESALGPDHSVVMGILENYSRLLRETGREAEANDMQSRAKTIRSNLK